MNCVTTGLFVPPPPELSPNMTVFYQNPESASNLIINTSNEVVVETQTAFLVVYLILKIIFLFLFTHSHCLDKGAHQFGF